MSFNTSGTGLPSSSIGPGSTKIMEARNAIEAAKNLELENMDTKGRVRQHKRKPVVIYEPWERARAAPSGEAAHKAEPRLKRDLSPTHSSSATTSDGEIRWYVRRNPSPVDHDNLNIASRLSENTPPFVRFWEGAPLKEPVESQAGQPMEKSHNSHHSTPARVPRPLKAHKALSWRGQHLEHGKRAVPTEGLPPVSQEGWAERESIGITPDPPSGIRGSSRLIIKPDTHEYPSVPPPRPARFSSSTGAFGFRGGDNDLHRGENPVPSWTTSVPMDLRYSNQPLQMQPYQPVTETTEFAMQVQPNLPSRFAATADFQAVHNSSHSRDITVHMELEVTEDYDEELEEFCRLTRIGNFRRARSFFEENLRTFVGNPSVFVQYAEMLFRQGDYRSIQLLDDNGVFPSAGGRDEDGNDTPSHVQNLQHNWRLIEAATLCFTQQKASPVLNKMPKKPKGQKSHTDRRTIGEMGSTEIRLLALEITICCEAEFRIVDTPVMDKWVHDGHRGSWHELYQQLTQNGRVWDFRDIMIAICPFYGPLEACRKMAGKAFPEPFDFTWVLDDWGAATPGAQPDESTLLALLDIFAFMTLGLTDTDEKVSSFAKSCLECADKLGQSLLDSFPETLTSRPVLFWTLTKAAISLRTQKKTDISNSLLDCCYSQNDPGLWLLSKRSCIALPTYIPVHKENPGWRTPHLPRKSSTLVEMVLKKAKDIENFEIQTLCLQELALRLRDPSRELNELATLQKTTHDMQGYLATCLTTRLITPDENSARILRMNLSDVGWWDDPSDLLKASRAAARDIIHLALCPRTVDEGPTPSFQAGLKYFDYLDSTFRLVLSQYYPKTYGGYNPRGAGSRSLAPAEEIFMPLDGGDGMPQRQKQRKSSGKIVRKNSVRDLEGTTMGYEADTDTTTPTTDGGHDHGPRKQKLRAEQDTGEEDTLRRKGDRNNPAGYSQYEAHVRKSWRDDLGRLNSPQSRGRPTGDDRRDSLASGGATALSHLTKDIGVGRHPAHSAPSKQLDLGPTVEGVSDDGQRNQKDAPEPEEVMSGPYIGSDPVDEQTMAQRLDLASQVPGERRAFSSSTDGVQIWGPRTDVREDKAEGVQKNSANASRTRNTVISRAAHRAHLPPLEED